MQASSADGLQRCAIGRSFFRSQYVRHRPNKLHTDKAYDYKASPGSLFCLRHPITLRIRRRGKGTRLTPRGGRALFLQASITLGDYLFYTNTPPHLHVAMVCHDLFKKANVRVLK